MGDSVSDGDNTAKEGGMIVPQQFGFTPSFPGPFGRWHDRRWRLI
jgi:hypothetical protein